MQNHRGLGGLGQVHSQLAGEADDQRTAVIAECFGELHDFAVVDAALAHDMAVGRSPASREFGQKGRKLVGTIAGWVRHDDVSALSIVPVAKTTYHLAPTLGRSNAREPTVPARRDHERLDGAHLCFHPASLRPVCRVGRRYPR